MLMFHNGTSTLHTKHIQAGATYHTWYTKIHGEYKHPSLTPAVNTGQVAREEVLHSFFSNCEATTYTGTMAEGPPAPRSEVARDQQSVSFPSTAANKYVQHICCAKKKCLHLWHYHITCNERYIGPKRKTENYTVPTRNDQRTQRQWWYPISSNHPIGLLLSTMDPHFNETRKQKLKSKHNTSTINNTA